MRYLVCLFAVSYLFICMSCTLLQSVTGKSPAATGKTFVVINEIMFDVPKGDEGDANGDGERSPESDEFIELANAGNTPADISGWQLLQKKLDVVFTFPAGVVLQPGELCVVFGGVGRQGFGDQFPEKLKIFSSQPVGEIDMGFEGGGECQYQNKGDNVILKNAAGKYIEEVYWGKAMAKTPAGIKLEGPNTKDGKSIAKTIRQSVTRDPDITGLWAKHRTVGNRRPFSPGALNIGKYVK